MCFLGVSMMPSPFDGRGFEKTSFFANFEHLDITFCRRNNWIRLKLAQYISPIPQLCLLEVSMMLSPSDGRGVQKTSYFGRFLVIFIKRPLLCIEEIFG